MNTLPVLGGPGGSGTWDDMFIYGKFNYIENGTTLTPGTTIYAAQLQSQWGWAGFPARPFGENPLFHPVPMAKPGWVQQNTIPTWQFLYRQLVSCEDVEILIVGEDFGHFLTVTGLVWTDADTDGMIDFVEGGMIHYIDPVTGAAGASQIWQAGVGTQLIVDYLSIGGDLIRTDIIMTVSESVPEPCTMGLLAFSGLVLLRRRRR